MGRLNDIKKDFEKAHGREPTGEEIFEVAKYRGFPAGTVFVYDPRFGAPKPVYPDEAAAEAQEYSSNTPSDYLNPEWADLDRVHNWRNYISDELKTMWHSFTAEQKAAISRNANEEAGREEWD